MNKTTAKFSAKTLVIGMAFGAMITTTGVSAAGNVHELDDGADEPGQWIPFLQDGPPQPNARQERQVHLFRPDGEPDGKERREDR